MNIGTPLVADTQAPEPMEPAQRSLDHPAPAAQVLLAFDASPGDTWSDAPLAQPLAVAPIVVALVSVQLGRTLSGPARQPRNRWQCPHQRLQQARVMNIGPRQRRYQWQPTLIDDDVVLATELAPVCGVGAGVIPAEGGKERWPSRCWRVPIRSGRTGVTCGAPPRAGAARRRRVANRADASSTSSRNRSPAPWASTPRGFPCAERTGCRSKQRGRSAGGDRPWARVCGPAAAVQ